MSSKSLSPRAPSLVETPSPMESTLERRPGAGIGNAERLERLGLGSGRGASGEDPAPAAGFTDRLAARAPGLDGADVSPADTRKVPAPTLTVFNNVAIPAENDRTTVGLAEANTLSADVDGGTWSSDVGVGRVERDGDYAWTAPATPGKATITYLLNGKATTMVMTVLAPTGLVGENKKEKSFSAGRHGAGMNLDLVLQPVAVSFAKLEWHEDDGGAVGTGIWAGKPLATDHELKWSQVGGKNEIPDKAWHEGEPKANWGAGTSTATVIEKYRVGPKGTPTPLGAPLKQVHTMLDSSGAAFEAKAGQPSDVRRP